MSGGAVAVLAEAALACGDLAAARRCADDTVAVVPGWHRMVALTARAFVALAQDEPDQADRDAHDALEIAARTEGYLRVPDTLECLARLAADGSNHRYASRLLGAAEAIQTRTGEVLFPVYQAGYDATVVTDQNALGPKDFEIAWTDGAALSTEEAIACAQCGRGVNTQQADGNLSPPAELDVVRLASAAVLDPPGPMCRPQS